jgi:hypothetical protein
MGIVEVHPPTAVMDVRRVSAAASPHKHLQPRCRRMGAVGRKGVELRVRAVRMEIVAGPYYSHCY